MNIYYNSRDLKYKKPFGAVKTGEKVSFFITCDADAVTLRLWFDNRETLVPMTKTKDGFSASFKMPENPQLLWYHFIIDSYEGRKYYFNNENRYGGEGILKDIPDGNSYQITVFKKDFKTPDWFKKSVMYQIFPDRFFGSGVLPKKRDEYILHKDWYEPFSFQKHPHENGPACNDFYGGNLNGICEKLPYLKDLGISVIYLNPIFDAYSNHKYDTANYSEIDPMFGTEEDFINLCKEAEKLGIRIILDGVFSHTGSDSIYFNKYGNYGENQGAYRDKNSPYRKWYKMSDDGSYESWWGCTNLPNINETEPTYLDYILRDEDAIIKKWLRLGAFGWRLDVADELPGEFIKILRSEAKSEKDDCVIIGEVWEDASNKISYSEQREYLLGDELDSVMNYPFKDSMIDFIMGNIDADKFQNQIMQIMENYPPHVLYSLMNIAGTHDTARIKTVLGGKNIPDSLSEYDKWCFSLNGTDESLAIDRVMLMAFMQMTFVGVPCIYYGDEIGMEGGRDPYNRKPYTWRKINPELFDFYKTHIKYRNDNDFLKGGSFVPLYAEGNVFIYLREIKGGKDIFGKKAENGYGIFAVNCGNDTFEAPASILGQYACLLPEKTDKIILSPHKSHVFWGK
ncbi:MAG: glycoside hydrolase family 13 protein [Ruminococcaceae bacterium]|nr:glycoside hydrolase family 13 protein [Oscillospiraceae bacterium]